MKLRKYIEFLNGLIKEDPDALDYEVVTSSDDEGNNFNKVYYKPSIGQFDEATWQFDNDKDAAKKPNAVCLN